MIIDDILTTLEWLTQTLQLPLNYATHLIAQTALLLRCNHFAYHHNTRSQLEGMAMGMKPATLLATLYCLRRELTSQALRPNNNRETTPLAFILFFQGYVDDGLHPFTAHHTNS